MSDEEIWRIWKFGKKVTRVTITEPKVFDLLAILKRRDE